MKIIFKKHNERKNSIHCVRDDGTETWMEADPFFVMHDLMHYAVETELGLKTGFYGLLESGIDITDFNKPREERNFVMTEEALASESLVNLLLIEYNQGTVDNFNTLLNEAYQTNDYPYQPPAISNTQHDMIMENFKSLTSAWHLLEYKNTLELSFNI